MSGRKQHPVWLCFTRDSSCRTNIKGKCKGCGEVVQGLVGRLEKHASCCRRLAALGLFGADHFASPSAFHSQSQSPPEQGSQDTGGTGGDPLVEPTGEPQRKKACVQTVLPVVWTENKEHSQLNAQLCRFVTDDWGVNSQEVTNLATGMPAQTGCHTASGYTHPGHRPCLGRSNRNKQTR